MSIFRKKSEEEVNPEELIAQLEKTNERLEFFLLTTRTLFCYLKEFSFNLPEINATDFQKRIDDLSSLFTSDEPVRSMARAFEDRKETILDFIEREKKYFAEHENDLKEIIRLLHNICNEIVGDNQRFNMLLTERNLKLEQITYLDDLRQVRESLKSEVETIRRIVIEKQTSDTKHIETLSQEVITLKSDLEQAKEASMTDALTGAENRLAFEMMMKEMIERNLVQKSPFSILMCDLDAFKSINDTYGHQIGDRVLRCFVRECRSLFRGSDHVARYGGEEFVIILPGAQLASAIKRGRLLCRTLSSKSYSIDMVSTERVSFTVSIGAAEVKAQDTVESLVERADQALRLAKATGKNKVVDEKQVPRSRSLK